MDLDNISKAEIVSCRKGLILCKEAKETIARAKACNCDVTDQEQLVTLAEDFLTRVNQTYGPQFPVKAT